MGWWKERKARKALEKIGMDKSYLKDLGEELKQGERELRSKRDEMRKIESPTYRSLILKINQIIDSDWTVAKKRWESLKMVKEARLSDYERNDLLEQIASIYPIPEQKSKVPKSQSNFIGKMDIHEMNKIYQEYGKVVQNVSLEALTKYPAHVYPVSLLPVSKAVMMDICDEMSRQAAKGNITVDVKTASGVRQLLESFIADDEANKRNSVLLDSPGWQEAVQRKK